MKKSELKELLKPLVKQCIKEVMFEEGVLSGIISEVARGMERTPTPAPAVAPVAAADPLKERMRRNAFSKEQSGKLREHKNKLMAAIGGDTFNGVDLFEGTTPVPNQRSAASAAGALSGQAPNDAGVDISNLFGSVGKNWNAHMGEIKEGKR